MLMHTRPECTTDHYCQALVSTHTLCCTLKVKNSHVTNKQLILLSVGFKCGAVFHILRKLTGITNILYRWCMLL